MRPPDLLHLVAGITTTRPVCRRSRVETRRAVGGHGGVAGYALYLHGLGEFAYHNKLTTCAAALPSRAARRRAPDRRALLLGAASCPSAAARDSLVAVECSGHRRRGHNGGSATRRSSPPVARAPACRRFEPHARTFARTVREYNRAGAWNGPHPGDGDQSRPSSSSQPCCTAYDGIAFSNERSASQRDAGVRRTGGESPVEQATPSSACCTPGCTRTSRPTSPISPRCGRSPNSP